MVLLVSALRLREGPSRSRRLQKLNNLTFNLMTEDVRVLSDPRQAEIFGLAKFFTDVHHIYNPLPKKESSNKKLYKPRIHI